MFVHFCFDSTNYIVPAVTPMINRNRLKIQGFMVYDFESKFETGIKQHIEWIKEVSLIFIIINKTFPF